jgi:hypothetical protein
MRRRASAALFGLASTSTAKDLDAPLSPLLLERADEIVE